MVLNIAGLHRDHVPASHFDQQMSLTEKNVRPADLLYGTRLTTRVTTFGKEINSCKHLLTSARDRHSVELKILLLTALSLEAI